MSTPRREIIKTITPMVVATRVMGSLIRARERPTPRASRLVARQSEGSCLTGQVRGMSSVWYDSQIILAPIMARRAKAIQWSSSLILEMNCSPAYQPIISIRACEAPKESPMTMAWWRCLPGSIAVLVQIDTASESMERARERIINSSQLI